MNCCKFPNTFMAKFSYQQGNIIMIKNYMPQTTFSQRDKNQAQLNSKEIRKKFKQNVKNCHTK